MWTEDCPLPFETPSLVPASETSKETTLQQGADSLFSWKLVPMVSFNGSRLPGLEWAAVWGKFGESFGGKQPRKSGWCFNTQVLLLLLLNS